MAVSFALPTPSEQLEKAVKAIYAKLSEDSDFSELYNWFRKQLNLVAEDGYSHLTFKPSGIYVGRVYTGYDYPNFSHFALKRVSVMAAGASTPKTLLHCEERYIQMLLTVCKSYNYKFEMVYSAIHNDRNYFESITVTW